MNDLESRVKDVVLTRLSNVKPTGRHNLRAECPFHRSKGSDRSFSISLETGAWLCFNESKCGERGSFRDLLRALGYTTAEIKDKTTGLYEGPAVAQHKRVLAEIAKEPVYIPDYILGAWSEPPQDLLDLGFREDILRDFEVGVDLDRNRIVFPIRDYLGRLAGISGRARENWMIPRYKVYDARPPTSSSPGGELYGFVEHYVPENRNHLYGFHKVYRERLYADRSCPPLILTEGYKSTLWVKQSLPSHPVGLQGSSLTVAQQRLLSRLQGPYYIMLDHEPGKNLWNQQGRCAAITISKQLEKADRVLICQYPPGKPLRTAPDDLTTEELNYALQNAKTSTQLILEKTQCHKTHSPDT